MGVYLGAIYYFLRSAHKDRIFIYIALFIVINLIDQWGYHAKFLKLGPHPREYFASDRIVRFLQQDKGIYRVCPINYHDKDMYLPYHGIQSVGGYVANPYHRYQEFIGAGRSVMFNPVNLINHPHLMDMLNVKYIIGFVLPKDTLRYNVQTRASIRFWRSVFEDFQLVFNARNGYGVYYNPDYLPRAYFISRYKVIPEKEAMLDTLLRNPQIVKNYVLLHEEPPKEYEPVDTFSETKIIDYTPNRIKIKVKNASPGFVVLLGNYHPNWCAYVDGKRVKVYLANYVFRGVFVEPGEHIVEFVYCDKIFTFGFWLAVIAILGFCGIVGLRLKGY
mgnify:CR=1 FL=1